MNAEVERLFDDALAIAPEHRSEFLSRECPHADIRREVELLLEHDRDAEAFLKQAIGGEAASVVQGLASSPGQLVGLYRILSVLGRGGMGLVYLAERADGKFHRQVAIKVVQAGFRGVLAGRLQQEWRILASLEHTNIARLMDAGATADGEPYFVMEYVAGQPIDRFCDERKLSTKERVQLMLPVCEAVQLAHQKLIVHCDLKPDNILVTAEGVPKLLDFGIAKVIGEVPRTGPETATRVLSPEYGSPEQVRGELAGTATDVYSLGGVLYKLLTGAAPHAANALRTPAEESVPSPRSLRPDLAGDLDHILRMALRAEPQRRYSSADQFADDLRRWLGERPVLASPDTLWYRSGKFLKRHWMGTAATVLVLVALTTGAVVAVWQARRAERRFTDVRRLANVFLFDFERSIHGLTGATQARQLLVKTALDYLRSLTREAADDPALMRELASAFEKVGDIQGDEDAGNVGDTAGAVRSYQESLSLRHALKEEQSADPATRLGLIQVWSKLANVQGRARNLDGAFQSCGHAISLGEAMAGTDAGRVVVPSALAAAYDQLAFLLLRRNDTKAALDYGRRSLTLSLTQAAANPNDPAAQERLALAYWAVGTVCEQTDAASAAIADFQKALPLYERLAAREPSRTALRRRLMIVYADLGRLQVSNASPKHRSPEGMQNLRRAYDVANQAVAGDSANAEAVSDLVAVAVRLGNSLAVTGQSDEGGRVLRRAVQAAGELVQRDPASGEDRLNLAIAHSSLGDFLGNQGRTQEAISQRRTAAGIYEELVADQPGDSKVLLSQVWNRLRIGDLLVKQGDNTGARMNYESGRTVSEKLARENPAFADVLEKIRKAEERMATPPPKRRS